MINSKTESIRFTVAEGKSVTKSVVKNGGLKGLVLVARRTKAGAISKSWRYITRTIDITLGSFNDYTIEEAREWHRQQIAKIERGAKPSKITEHQPLTMDALFLDWIEAKGKEPSKPGLKSVWSKHCSQIHQCRPEKFSYQMAFELLLRLGVTHAAHRTCQILKTIMMYGFQRYGIGGERAILVPQKLSEVHDRSEVQAVVGNMRSNKLSSEQYRTLWNSLGDSAAHSALKILMITGARKSEVTGMKWHEIDLTLNKWTLPVERTKSGKNKNNGQLNDRIYPLPKAIVDILNQWRWTQNKSQDLVFGYIGQSTLAHAVERLRTLVSNNFTTHDLRRSTASLMANEAAISPFLVDLLLGHSVAAKTSKILATYQPEAFAREANAKWPEWYGWFEREIISTKHMSHD